MFDFQILWEFYHLFGLVKRKFSKLFFRIKLEKWIQEKCIFWRCSHWLLVLEHWNPFRDTLTILTHSLTQTASKTIFSRISSVMTHIIWLIFQEIWIWWINAKQNASTSWLYVCWNVKLTNAKRNVEETKETVITVL